MRTSDEIKEILLSHLEFIRKDYHVKQIGIFGSYVSGNANENSDVDILVEFSKPIGLIEYIKLEEYLEEKIGLKVDLVLKDGIKPGLREIIIEQVVYV